MRILILVTIALFPFISQAQKVTREEAKKVCEVYAKTAGTYFEKNNHETDDAALKSALASSTVSVLQSELIRFTGELKGSYFEDISILSTELDRKVRTMYDAKVLPKEYYEKVQEKLKEVIK